MICDGCFRLISWLNKDHIEVANILILPMNVLLIIIDFISKYLIFYFLAECLRGKTDGNDAKGT